jgi:predicted phosphate transport protein (TIGR00153 family)
MPKFSLIPREEKFFDLFIDSSRNIVKAAHCLQDMLNNWKDREAKLAEITKLEHKGDTIAHQIVSLLHTTFVTPFDRDDIAHLSHTMDDILDFIHSAADFMIIYKVKEPTERAKELAEIIVQATEEVERVVSLLDNRTGLKKVTEHCVELNRLENRADKIFRSALGELFDTTKNTVYVIKWREIYEHMETATDRCEDVADVLEGVACKHA